MSLKIQDGKCSNFVFEGNDVRVKVDEKGDPWFVAKDAVEALDLVWDGARQLALIPEDWVKVGKLPTTKGTRNITFVNEKGLYKLAFRSNKDAADRFTNWVVSEVLPSIRKTGSYSTDQGYGDIEDTKVAGIVRALVDSQKALKQIKAVESKVIDVEDKVVDVEDKVIDVEKKVDRLRGDSGFRTIVGYQNDIGVSIPKGSTGILGQMASRFCRKKGYTIGKVPDEKWGTVNSYPKDALAKVFEDFFYLNDLPGLPTQ